MEEEEEVDILGDYDGVVSKTEREISNLSSGQILSCDYTVHPRWLDCTENDMIVQQEICIENDDDFVYCSEDEEISTKPIDISNPDDEEEEVWSNDVSSNIILEDDIPATVEEEVITNDLEINSKPLELNKIRNLYKNFNEENNENEIKIPKPNPRSILKNNRPEYKFKKTLTLNRNTFNSQKKTMEKLKKETVLMKLPKFKQKLKINLKKSDSILRNKLKRTKNKKPKSKIKKIGIIYDENITYSHSDGIIQNQTNKINENVSLQKITNEIESDVEIDIETPEPNLILDTKLNQNDEIKESKSFKIPIEIRSDDLKENYYIKTILENCSSDLKRFLESMDVPLEELILNSNEVSELEKLVHYEFFEGRPTKTPERYMKIRGHILNLWYYSKPGYVSKTAIRAGLKNCGDVNCFSRIHSLLEQIGAINFGCEGEFFKYTRPLTVLISNFLQPIKNNKSQSSHSVIENDRRPRKFVNYKQIDSNYTISHENNKIINKNDNPTKVKISRDYELIHCKSFSENMIIPFKVSISLSTVLCLYLHSLSSSYEVMGFLGGYRSKILCRNKISIARYKPCETSEQTSTTCEMCPVSQVEQATSLALEGYSLLGWFHSHPLFPPNPSRTDLRTQCEMQLQFSFADNAPFVGLIIGCLDMKLKCIYIMPDDLQLPYNELIPYEIPIDIIKDCTDFSENVMDVINLIKKSKSDLKTILDKFLSSASTLLSSYGYDISILKFINDLNR